jgi:hypothetical protein
MGENSLKKVNIKRPPLNFPTSDELRDTINALANAAESGNIIMQSLLEQEVWTLRFDVPDENRDWLIEYYYERGWEHGME